MSFKRTHKLSLIFLFLLVWELIARIGVFSDIIFPSISNTFLFMFSHPDKLMQASSYSLTLLVMGLVIGISLGFLISGLSMLSKKFEGVAETFISIFFPLPAISLIPFAILWFGCGMEALLFLVVWSTVFPFTQSVLNGFKTINPMYHDIGKNYGLTGWQHTWKITIPASLPHIITGFKVSWAACWKTVVAGELVFGSTSAVFGLGWYIYVNRFFLNSAGILACLAIIAIIGFVVENVILDFIEEKTVRKWGMKKKQ